MSAALPNPVWHTLTGPHRQFANSSGDTCWFVENVAPFIAVPSDTVVPALDEAFEAGLGEKAYFLGVLPKALPASWQYSTRSRVLQLMPPDPPAQPRGDVGRVLGPDSREAMYLLAQAAFPDFFRKRTAELGEYLGVFADDKLVAMAGERLRLLEYQEISGVCTHPAHAGRGYARELTLELLDRHRRRGIRSFLHVSEGNAVARRVYTGMGFTVQADLELGLVQRGAPDR